MTEKMWNREQDSVLVDFIQSAKKNMVQREEFSDDPEDLAKDFMSLKISRESAGSSENINDDFGDSYQLNKEGELVLLDDVVNDTPEIIDDPVRLYLREIGRVGLLSAKDERELARSMEEGDYINLVSQNPKLVEAGELTETFIANIALEKIVDNIKIFELILKFIGHKVPSSGFQVKDLFSIKDDLDKRQLKKYNKFVYDILDEELVNYIADAMNKEPLDTAETIRSTSTSLRLIPDFLFEVIEKYKKNTDLKKALKSGEIFKEFNNHSDDLSNFYKHRNMQDVRTIFFAAELRRDLCSKAQW